MVPNGGGTEGKVEIGWRDREIQREEEREREDSSKKEMQTCSVCA